VQRHIDPSIVATAGTRAGSPVLEAYQEHYAIPAGSPPLCQSDDPLAAASSSGRGRSRKGPNLAEGGYGSALMLLWARNSRVTRAR